MELGWGPNFSSSAHLGLQGVCYLSNKQLRDVNWCYLPSTGTLAKPDFPTPNLSLKYMVVADGHTQVIGVWVEFGYRYNYF